MWWLVVAFQVMDAATSGRSSLIQRCMSAFISRPSRCPRCERTTEVSSWKATDGLNSSTHRIEMPAHSPLARCRARTRWTVCRRPAIAAS
jgi:hypothetical protein